MNLQLLAPFVVAGGCCGLSLMLLRRLTPKIAVILLTTCIVLTTAVSFVMLLQLSAAGISEIPFVADAIGWCRALYGGQHGASPIIGIAALAAVSFAATRAGKSLRAMRRVRRSFSLVRGVEIVDSPEPFAFAVPGRTGGVVISRSLLEALDRNERHALLAHENAHLRHHHHRYVHLAEACGAALPFLRPMATRVRFLTERWADEVAAARVGSRSIVASTIAKVALLPGSGSHAHVLSMGETAVLERFDALNSPLAEIGIRLKGFVATLLSIATMGVLVQVHQLVEFLAHSGHM